MIFKSICSYSGLFWTEKMGCNTVIFVLQIICTSTHNVSFAQVRGSVPVYWSQPGYKYRPPPQLDRGIYFILCSIYSKHIVILFTGVCIELWPLPYFLRSKLYAKEVLSRNLLWISLLFLQKEGKYAFVHLLLVYLSESRCFVIYSR